MTQKTINLALPTARIKSSSRWARARGKKIKHDASVAFANLMANPRETRKSSKLKATLFINVKATMRVKIENETVASQERTGRQNRCPLVTSTTDAKSNHCDKRDQDLLFARLRDRLSCTWKRRRVKTKLRLRSRVRMCLYLMDTWPGT